MEACGSTANVGLVTGLMRTVDCYITNFAQGSYRDLVGPGTMFAAVFTGVLTVYIALMGYQLLLGRAGLRLTDLPVTALKIGLILSLLTSWAAYQTLVYDFLFNGPKEVTQIFLTQMDRLGGDFKGDVFTGLEKSFYDMTNAAAVYGRQAGGNVNILQGGPALGSGLLWLSAVTMLLTTVGLILATKIVLGFLLAAGPLFIGLFLFDATRGFFDGWLRTTIAFALAPLSATVLAAGMLLMLAPFTANVTRLAALNRFDMGAIVTIVIVVTVFAIVMSQILRVGFGIARGFRSPERSRAERTQSSVYVAAPAGVSMNVSAGTNTQERDRLREFSAQANSSLVTESFQSVTSQDRQRYALAGTVQDTQFLPSRLGESYRRTPLPGRRRGEVE